MVKLDDRSLPRFYRSNWGRLTKQNIKHAKLGSALAASGGVAAPGLDLEVLGKGSSLSQFHR
jgi:hypothetical protein